MSQSSYSLLDRAKNILFTPELLAGKVFGLYKSPEYLRSEIARRTLRKYPNYLGNRLLILTFDADTEQDASALWAVNERLREINIGFSIAVPGELIERNLAEYMHLHKMGVKFINHGYLEHTIYSQGEYKSTLFYHNMCIEDVRRDILRAHYLINSLFGYFPTVFRAPHFGTYQIPWNLHTLRLMLSDLGYTVSSTTLPSHAWSHGYFFDRSGLIEIPVSGRARSPFVPLDSWYHYSLRQQGKDLGDNSFGNAILELEKLGNSISAPCDLINIYADPSQVVSDESFFAALSIVGSKIRNIKIEEFPSILRL